MSPLKTLSRLLAALAVLPLAGCNTLLLNAPGDVARQQGDLIVVSTLLMLIIIVPVIALTLFFAWRYRASNAKATYKPDWDHSTQLELLIWAAPLVIIIALGAITWISTHTLDPYRPLDRIAEGKPVPEGVEPLDVQVVALDWKWLFLYPEQNIATVNELAAPVDRPIRFSITASSVMNSFYIPALAGQIYAMPGMETKLHAVMNRPGEYVGFSANYSGAGFSGMRFRFHGLSAQDFERWVAKVRAGGDALERADYLRLEKPSEREPVRYYAQVSPGLYRAILNRCVDTAKMCMDEMMAIDATGGLGKRGLAADALVARRAGDLRGGPVVASAVCAANDPAPLPAATVPSGPASSNPVPASVAVLAP
ncbi:ubiquinol oxidase subunit II [Vulcaniibacterium tengchongense]|uniref:Ubiquinol oxidase subunit 2 n=1 Tax=Vulcaniibacterium tengchongense TaxID=1273429 RepID=A0A3N4VWU1_9GAMM|nr:ubiquinol oxidase subunit II [Vulcaniibacterium tengchongense]RPE81547.1 cytochrome bo3 quinol oxidase subunit 2 [Vulcaniibacterium tengchongense]